MSPPTIRFLGVIPARGGSKGIPRKNLVDLGGRPLLAYTIDAAANSRHLSRTVVSTEDAEIAAVAESLGAEVPFVRPAEFATDEARSWPTVLHALEYVENEEETRYDAVVMLQPTTPLRLASDIDDAIDLFADSDCDSVVTVVDVGPNHPLRMKRLTPDGYLINFIEQGSEDMRPRQELPPVYMRNGAVYVVDRTVLVEHKSLVGSRCRALVMSEDRSVNVDGPMDLAIAERLLARRR